MTVNIGKSIYEGLSIVQFNELLKIASDVVPFGIYAIERKGVAISLKEGYWVRDYNIDYENGVVTLNLDKD